MKTDRQRNSQIAASFDHFPETDFFLKQLGMDAFFLHIHQTPPFLPLPLYMQILLSNFHPIQKGDANSAQPYTYMAKFNCFMPLHKNVCHLKDGPEAGVSSAGVDPFLCESVGNGGQEKLVS